MTGIRVGAERHHPNTLAAEPLVIPSSLHDEVRDSEQGIVTTPEGAPLEDEVQADLSSQDRVCGQSRGADRDAEPACRAARALGLRDHQRGRETVDFSKRIPVIA
jgi:hypothetical protein